MANLIIMRKKIASSITCYFLYGVVKYKRKKEGKAIIKNYQIE